MNVPKVERALALKNDVAHAAKVLDELKAEYAAAEKLAIEEMALAGVPSLKLSDPTGQGFSVSLSETLFPKMRDGVTREDVIKALSATPGGRDLVKLGYHGGAFNAFVRDLVRHYDDDCRPLDTSEYAQNVPDSDKLPAELRAVVSVASKTALSVRRVN